MSDFGDVLNTKLQLSQTEFVQNTNAVAVTTGLLDQVTSTAQSAIVQANQADTLDEKLRLVNQGLIDVVTFVEQAALFSKESVYKYRFESALLKELVALSTIDPVPDLDPEEEEENEEDLESDEQEEGADHAE